MTRKIATPAAVVQVTQSKKRHARGLGFVVAGGYVVTVAHNLPLPASKNGIYDCDCLVIETQAGDQLLMEPIFVDQCADLAVLGLSDANPETAIDALDAVPPLPIAWTPVVGRHSGTVATHDRGSVKVVSEVRAASIRVAFAAKSPFTSGTSGGPVCDGNGRAMAVVSQTTSAADHRQGWGPALGECLPAWLAKRILSHEKAIGGGLTSAKPADTHGKRKQPRARG
jgi:S1-C subfamily serine protease